MKQRKCKKGEVICRQGEPADCLYLIRWGSLGVYANYATSRQRELGVLREGDYFGEMGLLEGEPRSATVVVLDHDTVVSRIGEDEFAELFAENPARVMDLFRRLSHKLHNATKEYLDICQAVRDKVGDAAEELDDAVCYGLMDDQRLVAIHDKVAGQDADTDSAPALGE